ncbi:uncharacterized protein [Euphorbia lathyris]|uniref:uncharacterized protein n=1 Tax=Euphorbia lathyris TaxID=212925 RepID=UPI0033131CF7
MASSSWSPENATKAYLTALKMGKRGKEPDTAEFISALAAGNNAKHMVIASSTFEESITLSLIAAAHQTNGQVVCIFPSKSELQASKKALTPYKSKVKSLVGDAKTLLLKHCKEADFILIDCKIEDCEEVFKAALECGNHGYVVGYNAFQKGHHEFKVRTQFLPIGEGLMVCRIGSKVGGRQKKSRWVVRVDKCTGEEHVYRIPFHHQIQT